MNNEKEVFKDIPNYNGFYQVSNLGRVISTRYNRILKFDNSSGYSRVTLSLKNNFKRFSVHRLVALMFIDNTLNKPQVNHIDENKNNNNFTNLEYISHRNNISYSATKKSITGVNGVHWIEAMKRYQCSVFYKGKKVYLGSTKEIEVAKEKVLNFKQTNRIL